MKLSGMGLKLKDLTLSFFSFLSVSVDSRRMFLQSQASCLEKLHWNNDVLWRDMETTQLNLEWMPRMEKLKVVSSKLYSKIPYSTQFPKLKKLILSSYTVLESFLDDQVEPVETVEQLELEFSDPSSGLILQAARQFPKLRKIAISLVAGHDWLNCLGHSMPQLEEICLNVYQRTDLDALLTGYLPENVKELKDLPSSEVVLEENREPEQFLKNLRKLRITGDGSRWPEELSLSDFGCRFALLKMENLRVLEIKGNLIHEISDQVMERMRKKFVVLFEN